MQNVNKSRSAANAELAYLVMGWNISPAHAA